ncbi:hypothetical protein AT15_05330 [Kosmotoga arenicorallina S304]|uniref:6-phosphogluconate dehydrogenase C-terminal domain-containing protein n=1 Tax=Kosmotoga arenicorallina S304 TaxID=1453497 RepID=A0A176JUJ1_9BACT|nr:NADP-dependent phosphogluconate dehydrogenase [Kosmotoga arenicorallina]OAA27114.1 hypothetical protein AT15_05330 [Kosmotoga arenicorallina S304]
MRIGIIGLGKMGFNMSLRLKKHGIEVVAYDSDSKACERAKASQIDTKRSIEEVLYSIGKPKIVLSVVPSGKATNEVLNELFEKMDPEDIVVDCGNSHYKESIEWGEKFAKKGVRFVDAGVSGGIHGLKNGYCIMAGGDKSAVDYLKPVFLALTCEKGFVYTGGYGRGHYVKMVHNAIEYAMMEALAEGAQLLHEGPFEDLNTLEIYEAWNHGSIVSSFLLEMLLESESNKKDLEDTLPCVPDSGEGRWAAETAIEYKIPAFGIIQSLLIRFLSQKEEPLFLKLLALQRNKFGGHEVKRKTKE